MRRTRRPPTRVTTACDRCRRQKQRCDDFRPCSNCLYARTECATSELPPSNKKLRPSTRQSSQDAHALPGGSSFQAEAVASSNDMSNAQSLPQAPYTSQPTSIETADPLHQDEGPLDPSDTPNQESVFAELRGSESAIDITKKILGFARSPSDATRATFAIPGGGSAVAHDATPVRGPLRPIKDILGTDLPSRDLSDALIDTYFATVHWFSLVIYEPKFRQRYITILDSGVAHHSDRPFLLLLLMIMVMGAWYGPGVLPAETLSTTDLDATRKAYLSVVSQSFMDLIDEDCLEFVQLSSLLGSYWLYWGRPRSSFSILGAATKSAQAMELHRNKDKGLSSADAEERKRVWWTIYTWDRFATIIYGRPLGINDKDCNVPMPSPITENVSFSPGVDNALVCLSSYQINLNRIYQIASPLLENIYGIRYSHDRSLRSQMPSMVTKIDHLMQKWQDDLPTDLHLGKHEDMDQTCSTEEKMHLLQALSLQLTYDNLMIVIHRPLLADQNYRRSRGSKSHREQDRTAGMKPRSIPESNGTNDISFRQCLDSALRISRIQQSKRNLLALARGTHLVSFLGMNLFTSSVVMFICALSDTLSDVAQEAKRGMARNLRMLKLLSGDGSLSMQCSVILEDLVQQVVDKEKEEMLRGLPTDDEVAAFVPTRRRSLIVGHTGGSTNGIGLDNLNHAHELSSHMNAATTNHGVGHGGVALNQAMASLQEVFRDVAAPRAPLGSTSHSMGGSHQQYFQHSQMQPTSQGDTRPDYAGFTFDGSNFNTEDLGQFWLWNMDPHMDDSVASWQSGDEQPW